MALLEVQKLRKAYGDEVVVDGSFSLERGEQVAMIGPSGCGKSTLLHLISGVLRPDSGSVSLDGQDLATLKEASLDRYRARQIGYIFQSFHLLEGLTALENVETVITFAGESHYPRAEELLRELGLEERLSHYPSQLSVGQRQRVAVARAVVNNPPLVLADEPTANLDPAQAKKVVELLQQTCKKVGAALLLVSHDMEAVSMLDRVVAYQDIFRTGS